MSDAPEFLFAPMEGITGYLYRNVHHKFFPGITAYYSPFISPNEHHFCSPKEYRDILPENNEGIRLIPQVITNQADLFCYAAREMKYMGYQEINLNLGCPSGTVVTKYKGSGMLKDTDRLDHFLEEIFAGVDVQVSVKTRLGYTEPEEFCEILDIYNKYPIKELIIHPRVRQEFYKKVPHQEMYAYALEQAGMPLCYNGNIFSKSGYDRFRESFPGTKRIMLGRGLIANPGLADELAGQVPVSPGKLRAFLDEILIAYDSRRIGQKNLLFKLKEQWYYMASIFPEGTKQIKQIRKATTLEDYNRAVDELFSVCPPDTTYGFYFA